MIILDRMGIVDGIRVVEVASWGFVPMAGAVMADWGADVIKIEHPGRPDPLRGLNPGNLARADIRPRTEGGDVDPRRIMMEQANRGKRSIGLDVGSPGGKEILHRLVESADVFLTNMLPSKRARLGIEPDDLRAINPRLVYVRGSGFGVHGDEADKPGFDGTAFVSRGSFAHQITPTGSEWPVLATGVAGVGDLPGAMMIAGGILGGLLQRERTGVPAIVDVSLLSTAVWQMATAIIATGVFDLDEVPRPSRDDAANPLTLFYRLKDGRFIKLSLQVSDPYFPELCNRLGAPELAEDPRFANQALRRENSRVCVHALDELIARHTVDDIRRLLKGFAGPWEVVQTPREIHDDPQVIANDYLRPVLTPDGTPEFMVVGPPVQFDERAAPPVRKAPEHGEHTDEVLSELGLDWDTIVAHKVAGAVL